MSMAQEFDDPWVCPNCEHEWAPLAKYTINEQKHCPACKRVVTCIPVDEDISGIKFLGHRAYMRWWAHEGGKEIILKLFAKEVEEKGWEHFGI